MQLRRVVLPAPFGPITDRISPWATSKLTTLTACTPPKDLETSRIASWVFTTTTASGACSAWPRRGAPPPLPTSPHRMRRQNIGGDLDGTLRGLPQKRDCAGEAGARTSRPSKRGLEAPGSLAP